MSSQIEKDNLIALSDLERYFNEIEKLVQQDEGGRGITAIVQPRGELFAAANSLITAHTIAIITGFPCMLDFTPPTETDGPLGAFAIARVLLKLGKNVIMLTDECNEEVILGCCASADLLAEESERLKLESFPGGLQFEESDLERLGLLAEEIDFVVAIERSGPNFEGKYLTMRGRDMSHLIAPLDILLSSGEIQSIGIGDGGNEVGMGKVLSTLTSSDCVIPNASMIACVVPATYLIVASVSNWGGYALAGAIALLHSFNYYNGNIYQMDQYLNSSLPSDDIEIIMCQRMLDCGARDGITGKNELMVDGMPLESSLIILRGIRNILKII